MLDDQRISYSLSPSKRQPKPPPKRRNLNSPPKPPNPSSRFLITEYRHRWVEDTLLVWCTTDRAIHLTLVWTSKPLGKHKIAFPIAGYQMTLLPYFCFVEYTPVEQDEAGDTLEHTFTFDEWTESQERWWLIYGDVGGIRSPSSSPVFYAHFLDYGHADPSVRFVEGIGKHSTLDILTGHVKIEGRAGITVTRDQAHNSLVISAI